MDVSESAETPPVRQEQLQAEDAVRQEPSDALCGNEPQVEEEAHGTCAKENEAQAAALIHKSIGLPSNGMKQASRRPYRSLKKRKVEPACCDLCNVDCSSHETLNEHKLGKRHQRNLKKLKISKNEFTVEISTIMVTAGENVVATEHGAKVVNENDSSNILAAEPHTSSVQANVAPEDKKGRFKKAKKKRSLASMIEVDLEAKRQKLLDLGTAADSLRECTVCNVICNSETVLKLHLAGQKHAAKVANSSNGIQPVMHSKSSLDPVAELDVDSKSISNPDPHVIHNPKSNSDSGLSPSPAICNGGPLQPALNNAAEEKKKKKTKTTHLVWCEVCSVNCSGQGVFERHKMGRKHKRKLEKSSESKNVDYSVTTDNSESQLGCEARSGGERGKKATASASKVCTLCNVVCNSKMSYGNHLRGRKHAARMRKHAVELAKPAVNTSAMVASVTQPEPISTAGMTTAMGIEPVYPETVTSAGTQAASVETMTTSLENQPVLHQ